MEPREQTDIIQLIEALLFLENRPVNIKYISKLTGTNKEEIQISIAELKKRYHKEGSSLVISQNANDDFHLTISPSLYDQLGKYYDSRRKMRLSNQALETLAIIAYKQPITRIEIEKIRGVQVGHIMRILLEHKFIKFVGKKNVVGRPLLYGTTDKFLKYFGLLSLKDLPPINEFEKT